MTSLRAASSFACMLVLALGCNPAVTEANDDDVADESSSEGESDGGDSSSTSESESDTDDTTEESSGDDPGCTPGTLDCACDENDICIDGLLCVEGVCTMPDMDTETTDDEMNVCGWDPRNEWYFCGWEGEDPSMEHPISCEEIGFPMVPGSPCNGMLGYVGCCDAMGNAWYCLEGLLEYEVCGGG
jgi:hypothetical protein